MLATVGTAGLGGKGVNSSNAEKACARALRLKEFKYLWFPKEAIIWNDLKEGVCNRGCSNKEPSGRPWGPSYLDLIPKTTGNPRRDLSNRCLMDSHFKKIILLLDGEWPGRVTSHFWKTRWEATLAFKLEMVAAWSRVVMAEVESHMDRAGGHVRVRGRCPCSCAHGESPGQRSVNFF